MSYSWLTKLVLALAFTVLPLQALAETIQVFLCHSSSAAAMQTPADGHAHSQSGHDHVDATQTAHESHSNPYDDSAGGHNNHFCCGAAAAALPLCAKPLADEKFSSIAATVEVRYDSTFLKLLQRPPLA